MQGNEKFLRRVASYAHKHALWREGERILAAVSGGPDSLALLLALKLLAVKEKINIGCCCVNHHLRAAAGKEAEFVESVCREWNIPFILKEVDVQSAVRNGGSIETAARISAIKRFVKRLVAADMQRLPSLIMVMIRQRRFYIIYFAGAV